MNFEAVCTVRDTMEAEARSKHVAAESSSSLGQVVSKNPCIHQWMPAYDLITLARVADIPYSVHNARWPELTTVPAAPELTHVSFAAHIGRGSSYLSNLHAQRKQVKKRTAPPKSQLEFKDKDEIAELDIRADVLAYSALLHSDLTWALQWFLWIHEPTYAAITAKALRTVPWPVRALVRVRTRKAVAANLASHGMTDALWVSSRAKLCYAALNTLLQRTKASSRQSSPSSNGESVIVPTFTLGTYITELDVALFQHMCLARGTPLWPIIAESKELIRLFKKMKQIIFANMPRQAGPGQPVCRELLCENLWQRAQAAACGQPATFSDPWFLPSPAAAEPAEGQDQRTPMQKALPHIFMGAFIISVGVIVRSAMKG